MAGPSKRIERRRLHLDRKDAPPLRSLYSLCGFSEWSVGGPSRADDNAQSGGLEGIDGHSRQLGIGFAIFEGSA